jgi:hypothetical protein
VNSTYPHSYVCCIWNDLTSKVIGSRKLVTEKLKHYIFAKNIDAHASNIRHFLCPCIIKAKYGGVNLHQPGSNIMYGILQQQQQQSPLVLGKSGYDRDEILRSQRARNVLVL